MSNPVVLGYEAFTREQERSHGWIVHLVALVAALMGLVFSVVLIVEKLLVTADSSHVSSCTINGVVSCNNVLSSPQASAFFGVPNPVWGVAGFSVVALVAFLSLFVVLPAWFMRTVSVGVGFALVFCLWLSVQASFFIEAMCLYCMGTWLVTSVLFWVFARVWVPVGKRSWLWVGFVVSVLMLGSILLFAFVL